ncbi:MAG: hypothetical protein V5B30_07080 [Candidatus Accumulibacter delftensis]
MNRQDGGRHSDFKAASLEVNRFASLPGGSMRAQGRAWTLWKVKLASNDHWSATAVIGGMRLERRLNSETCPTGNYELQQRQDSAPIPRLPKASPSSGKQRYTSLRDYFGFSSALQDNPQNTHRTQLVISAYHPQYLACELTRRCPPDSGEKLAGVLVDAQVDLKPHQVDGALFTFNSPLSKGALLADQRVFDLLSEEFQLFEGVFGASDEVLGARQYAVAPATSSISTTASRPWPKPSRRRQEHRKGALSASRSSPSSTVHRRRGLFSTRPWLAQSRRMPSCW